MAKMSVRLFFVDGKNEWHIEKSDEGACRLTEIKTCEHCNSIDIPHCDNGNDFFEGLDKNMILEGELIFVPKKVYKGGNNGSSINETHCGHH